MTNMEDEQQTPDNRIWKNRVLPPKPDTPNYTKEYKDWEKLKKFLETPPEGFAMGTYPSIRKNKVKVRYTLENFYHEIPMKDGRVKRILKFRKDDEPKVIEFTAGLPNMEGWRVGDLVEVDVKVDIWTDKNGNIRHSYVQPSDVTNISLLTGYMRNEEDPRMAQPLFDILYLEIYDSNERLKKWRKRHEKELARNNRIREARKRMNQWR